MNVEDLLQNLVKRYPVLTGIRQPLFNAYEVIKKSYETGGKLLICGNGGSAADADHIAGELMKSFSIKRPVNPDIQGFLKDNYGKSGIRLSEKLEGALPAISLSSHPALNTAFANDVDPDLIFAQQIVGYGNKGDTLLGISTSGNSTNVVFAMMAAKAKGLTVVGLVGRDGGEFVKHCDVLINVGGTKTPEIQELHLPVYHTLCGMLEVHFYGNH